MEKNKSIKCLVVDDEQLSLDLITAYLEKIPNMEVVQQCTNVFEANQVLQKEEIDLLFLDIEMPELSGLEFLKMLKTPPETIFITAYANYAIEGFELDAADYLLKPVEFDRFFKAIDKAVNRIRLKNNDLIASLEPTVSKNEDEYFFVKADRSIVKIKMNEILTVEGLKEYIRIRTVTQKIITLQSITKMEDILPSTDFFRIHRSHIINLNKIDRVRGNEVFIGEICIPISRGKKDEFLTKINKYNLF